MPDILIRNISGELKSRIQKQARADETSLSDAAKTLIEKGFSAAGRRRLLGTELFNLIAPEDRIDLDCDLPDETPDFS